MVVECHVEPVVKMDWPVIPVAIDPNPEGRLSNKKGDVERPKRTEAENHPTRNEEENHQVVALRDTLQGEKMSMLGAEGEVAVNPWRGNQGVEVLRRPESCPDRVPFLLSRPTRELFRSTATAVNPISCIPIPKVPFPKAAPAVDPFPRIAIAAPPISCIPIPISYLMPEVVPTARMSPSRVLPTIISPPRRLHPRRIQRANATDHHPMIS